VFPMTILTFPITITTRVPSRPSPHMFPMTIATCVSSWPSLHVFPHDHYTCSHDYHYKCSPWPSQYVFPMTTTHVPMTITTCAPHDHHYTCFPMTITTYIPSWPSQRVPHDHYNMYSMTITCSPWPPLQVFPHHHHYTCSPWPPLHVSPFSSCAVITGTIHMWTMSAGSNSEGASC
jgi:hypothetical protein